MAKKISSINNNYIISCDMCHGRIKENCTREEAVLGMKLSPICNICLDEFHGLRAGIKKLK
jgi:hypothetical protein